MPGRDRIEAGFEQARAERFLHSHRDQAADPACARWRALAPHRDSLGADPAVLARRLFSPVAVWSPPTDVTPLDSCMYLVPAACDPDYYSEERGGLPPRHPFTVDFGATLPFGTRLAWIAESLHEPDLFGRVAR